MLQTHPQLKIILYISGSGGLLERMAGCRPDIMSIDQHVDMSDAIRRIGPDFAVQVRRCDATANAVLHSCNATQRIGTEYAVQMRLSRFRLPVQITC